MKLKLLLALGVAALAVPALAAGRLKLDTGAPESARRMMLGQLPATNRLEIGIGLPLRNQDQMNTLLRQMYDVKSTNYHQYLTPEQFGEQFGATREDYQRVMDYARSNNLQVVRTFVSRAFVNVSGTVADLERTFQVRLGTFQHPTEDRVFFGPDVEPTVDAGLPVKYISGLDNYFIAKSNIRHTPVPAGASPDAQTGSGTNGLFLGSDFRKAYMPGVTLNGSGQTIGLYEQDGYTPSDISLYLSLAGLSSVPLHPILNNFAPGSGNDEVAIDIEMCIAMAPKLAGINVYEASDRATTMNEIATPTQGEVMPLQVSCSWGIAGYTDIYPALQQMCLQGQTFFYALGDNGAFQNGVITGTYSNFIYMTTCGGTTLTTSNGGTWASEMVWHNSPGTNFTYFATAGGVANTIPIPDFQKLVSMANNGGSTNYRDLPDVALIANQVEGVYTDTNLLGQYVVTNSISGFVGTSIAAPLWAGVTALANQQAAQYGIPQVGFINPALYNIGLSQAYGGCFHDIIVGNNVWSNSATGANSDNLYYATNGYDLCTGWGTPAGQSLLNTLLDFSGPKFVDFNYTGSMQNGTYLFPFNTLAKATNAVSDYGTIIFKTAGSSSETMTIAKPMNLNASDGPATIGN